MDKFIVKNLGKYTTPRFPRTINISHMIMVFILPSESDRWPNTNFPTMDAIAILVISLVATSYLNFSSCTA
jgi:hypothetical protein